MENPKSKALVLFSGGLDSVITVKLLQEQNIHVTAMFINNGFRLKSNNTYMQEIVDVLGIELIDVQAQETFFEMWKEPSFGYGSAVNPCINCHALMANIALQFMERNNFDFVATGDVLEQRGFSQTSMQLNKVISLIERPEKILRPLSAKSLTKTPMEISGAVDRELLLDIKGKSRKIQYELLKKYNINSDDVEAPAGGCMLTESKFKEKINAFNIQELTFDDFHLLKHGKVSELPNGKKIITSRNSKEEHILSKYTGTNFVKVKTTVRRSPIAFVELNRNDFDFWNVSNLRKERVAMLLSEVYDFLKGKSKIEDGEVFGLDVFGKHQTLKVRNDKTIEI